MEEASVPDNVTMPPPSSRPLLSRPLISSSPPPNCAICLGSCTNKSFSDSCRHQFCFTCLLEWSKIKPECPLCKQRFTTIIHNIKSNNEYDEHIVSQLRSEVEFVPDEYLFIPTPHQASSRHFQFRTTFTVDPRGEFAIQQMLLSHPLTNSVAWAPTSPVSPRNFGHRRYRRARRDVSSTNYRRSIYESNLWVVPLADFTGRFREASPRFYREYPGAITRLTPWLNRELNALLMENTQNVMMLVDLIVTHLGRHHIKSCFFRRLLRSFLGNRTQHFIHEFHNYMQSPYDMVGYDRHCSYIPFHESLVEDEERSSDEDVSIVSVAEPDAVPSGSARNPFQRPMIEVIEIPSDDTNDSDVIIEEPPPPVVVDLVNSTDDDDVIPVEAESATSAVAVSGTSSSVSIDVKIRRKRKRKCRQMRHRSIKWEEHHRRKGHGASMSDSDDDSSQTETSAHRLSKRGRGSTHRSRTTSKISTTSSSSSSSSSSSDSSSMDEEPRRKRTKDKVKTEHHEKPCPATSTTSVGTECVKKEYCEATTNTEYWDTVYPPTPLDYSLPIKHDPVSLGLPGPSTSTPSYSKYGPPSHWRYYKSQQATHSSDSDF